MGIYPNRGVEYRVDTVRGRSHVVVPAQQSDARLLASKFFEARRDTWFSGALHERRTRIDAADFDVELTDREVRTLQQLLDRLGGDVLEHGWFDVTVIHTTYDWPTLYRPYCTGLEYRTELHGGGHVTVVHAKDTGERLELVANLTPGFIDEPQLQLTEGEAALLAAALNVHDVARHGWYYLRRCPSGL